MWHMNIPYMVYLGENHTYTFVTYTDVYMLPMYTYICVTICHIHMYACLSIYAIYDFVYMSHTHAHTYTYTYVTYLHKHIWHTPNNICYLYVYTYKLRNPASFPDRRWSGKETGFLSLVYMHCIYTNTKVTYVHVRNLMSLSSYLIYVHVYMLPTYTFICHLHKYPYMKDTHMHAYVIHMW